MKETRQAISWRLALRFFFLLTPPHQMSLEDGPSRPHPNPHSWSRSRPRPRPHPHPHPRNRIQHIVNCLEREFQKLQNYLGKKYDIFRAWTEWLIHYCMGLSHKFKFAYSYDLFYIVQSRPSNVKKNLGLIWDIKKCFYDVL